MLDRLARLLGLAGATALLGACSGVDATPAEEASPVNVVSVTSGDFYFQMPDTLSAGLTSFRLVNEGQELHHIQAVRLEDGRTLRDFTEHLAAENAFPEWAVEVGGPNAGVPGAETEATFALEPGTYAIVCMIPSPDGTPHIMKGMMKQVAVVAGDAAATELPPADVTIVLDDYSFEVTPALTAGRRVIRVENRAAQPHEVLLARLEPGKTPMDLVQWTEKPEGPPPAAVVGGTTAFRKGIVNQATVDLVPGEYALICFIPDATDGKPHFVHGMMTQVTVR